MSYHYLFAFNNEALEDLLKKASHSSNILSEFIGNFVGKTIASFHLSSDGWCPKDYYFQDQFCLIKKLALFDYDDHTVPIEADGFCFYIPSKSKFAHMNREKFLEMFSASGSALPHTPHPAPPTWPLPYSR
jgi:hypothetical protein